MRQPGSLANQQQAESQSSRLLGPAFKSVLVLVPVAETMNRTTTTNDTTIGSECRPDEGRGSAPISLISALQSSSRCCCCRHRAEQELTGRGTCRRQRRTTTIQRAGKATDGRRPSSIGDEDGNDNFDEQKSVAFDWGSSLVRVDSRRYCRRRRQPNSQWHIWAAATRSLRSFPLQGSWVPAIILLCVWLVNFPLFQVNLLEAKSIDDSAPASSNAKLSTVGVTPEQTNSSNSSKQQVPRGTPAPAATSSISLNALASLIEKVTSAFTPLPESTKPAVVRKEGEAASDNASTAEVTSTSAKQTATTQSSRSTTKVEEISAENTIPDNEGKAEKETITTTTESTQDEEEDNGKTGTGIDDNDAEDCQGLSGGPSAPGKEPSDNERLVNLQTCLQKKVKKQLMGALRSGMDIFDQLSLSGACSASLINLMSSLGELKGFAFKFLDASAKIPSGMMSGLLSDFGDFEQCLAIRSNPRIEPWQEVEEGGYSGKYCLFNIRVKYSIKLGPNSTPPEGIYPDGVLWNELVRLYWTSNSSKSFQVGVCVPSRCNQDDLDQMAKLLATTYHFQGEISACQDGTDLRRQQEPDVVQLAIIYAFLTIIALNLLGTYIDCNVIGSNKDTDRKHKDCSLTLKLLACFSIRRNWHIFLHGRGGHSMNGDEPSAILTNENTQRDEDVCRSPLISMSTEDTLAAVEGRAGSSSSGSFTLTSREDGSTINSEARHYEGLGPTKAKPAILQPLAIKILPKSFAYKGAKREPVHGDELQSGVRSKSHQTEATRSSPITLDHLWGLKLVVLVWITVGHSFLYPSANNYQQYRSLINLKVTRNSVWFATTNFILGIDMLLYMAGLTFAYKLAHLNHPQPPPPVEGVQQGGTSLAPRVSIGLKIAQMILRKLLRFWPVYLSVIALAIVVPLVSAGPMWPEVVSRRLGQTCRANWWANLLMINNFFDSTGVCLPSSWFISVIMQCFLIGSAIAALATKCSLQSAMIVAGLLISLSSVITFWLSYLNKLNAPAIRMDESFVMELDKNIFRMYTSTLSNLGPFLVGMIGGLVLLRHKTSARRIASTRGDSLCTMELAKNTNKEGERDDTADELVDDLSRVALPVVEQLSNLMFELNLAFAIALVALVVLSSVFFTDYTPFWSAVYWSCHRVGWALVTGYLIHQCATGKWRLLGELLSLSTFIPLGRLIFIAYLVHPLFIHIHSGLVRDGLHLSLYNMLNIYITRLVMTFALALVLHIVVELPFYSMEESLLNAWFKRMRRRLRRCKLSRAEYGAGDIHQQTLKATKREHIQGGENVAGEPLLKAASNLVQIKGHFESSPFERQETTETTLSGGD